jgi:hypothetical protein
MALWALGFIRASVRARTGGCGSGSSLTETTVNADASYDMIVGRDLISELKLVLDFDTQCITWDNIYKPMKQQGGLQKETSHYEDLYSALMAPASTIFQDN